MIDYDLIDKNIILVCTAFERTAPVVSRWADDLYMRIHDNPREALLGEIITIQALIADGSLLQANYAQNVVYKWLENNSQAEGILSF